MAITIPGSITGAAQTGFTSPTYTTTVDGAVETNSKQVAITALGGTQVGVVPHSNSYPFTIAFFRPKQYQQIGKPNPTTGVISSVPKNTYKMVVRKGVNVNAAGQTDTALATVEFKIPAGADTYDTGNIRALFSALIGGLQAVSAGLGDTAINGIL